MKKVLETLSKVSKWPFIGLSFTFAVLWSMGYFTRGGNFFSSFAGILLGLLGLGVLCVVPVLILLKKEGQAKIVFYILAGYWLISSILSEVGMASLTEWEETTSTLYGIFAFIFGLSLIALLAFIVLVVVLKKPLYKVILSFILIGVIAFAVIVFIFAMIFYGKGEAGWYSFVDAIASYLIAPAAVGFGLLFYNGVPEEIK